MCLRPHSAGSTIPRLRPIGSSLEIAPVDYDPVVLHKPFGPRLAARPLPSRASSMVAPGRPIRVPAFAVVPHEPLHTFHPLWPVRRYPHLRISVRGPGPSGTSTHLTRQLPGTHYEGATTSHPASRPLLVRGRAPRGPPGSCSPRRSRADGGAARAWAVWSAGGPVPAGVRMDEVGSHRFPGDPSRAFARLQDPGRISG